MEQLTKILTSNFTSNALITAFVVVGIVCWVAAWISTHVFRGKIHSSAIAIAAGLLLAWLGGELTGGKKGDREDHRDGLWCSAQGIVRLR